MTLKSHTRKSSLLIAACLLASTAGFAQESAQSGITLTPSVGYHSHATQKQGLEDSENLSFGAGYQFNNPWAVELAYLKSEPELAFGDDEVDEEQFRLDALYYLSQQGKLMPYTVIGAGESQFELDGVKEDNTIVNAGLGLKYAFNSVVSLRSDVRAVNYLDSETTQGAFNLGLSFLLGGGSSKPRPVADTDKDGVTDNLDSCPGTEMGMAVDANGCPIKVDSDRDGVYDAVDQCPDTKAGAKVDKTGCYIMLTEEKTVTLQLQFENNAASVVNKNDPQLIALSRFLKEYPETQVVLGGYTDSRGSADYNLQLSQKRAQAVATILEKNYGVDASRIQAKGYGEANPVADNSSAQGRAQNRRVEAKVSATVEKIAE